MFKVTRIRIWTKIQSDRRIGPENTTDRRICIPLFTPLFKTCKMAVARQNTRRPPARPENYCKSKQTYFSYSLDKAFHSPEFQAKLFFTRNWVGGFYWDSLLIFIKAGCSLRVVPHFSSGIVERAKPCFEALFLCVCLFVCLFSFSLAVSWRLK